MLSNLKWFLMVVAIGALSVVGYGYGFGAWRVQRDVEAFVSHLQTCAPFSQDAWVPMMRMSAARRIRGPFDEICAIEIEVVGGRKLLCEPLRTDLPALAQAFRDNISGMGFFGDSPTPESGKGPLTAFFDSSDCWVTGE